MGKHRAQRFTSNQVEMIEIGGPENLSSKQVAQLFTRLPGQSEPEDLICPNAPAQRAPVGGKSDPRAK